MTDRLSPCTIRPMAKDPTRRAEKRPWSDVLARRIRLARGSLTQQALADRLGISKPSLSSWENADTAPTVDNLDQLSRELHVSIDWLMGRGPEDLPAIVAEETPLQRSRVATAAAAVLDALLQIRRAPTPEDLAAMILVTHDWAAGNEKQRGAPPSFEEVLAFVRDSMKMPKNI